MASSLQLLILFSLTFISVAQFSNLPNTLIFPVAKHKPTLQYVTQIYKGTPLVPATLIVDLGRPFLGFDCSSSASHRPICCRSIKCARAQGTCSNTSRTDTCTLSTKSELVEEILAVQSINGRISTVDDFLHSCGTTFSLPTGVDGALGLGRSPISLPSQLATSLSVRRRFAVCLSPSTGFILSGDGVLPNTDIRKSLIYTPLITNQNAKPSEYYINMKSIKINGKSVTSSSTGETTAIRISTVVPYTTMKTSLYETFTRSYIKEATESNMSMVAPVAPFSVCFKSPTTGGGGAIAPTIDLVLQSDMVRWRIGERNSMVRVSDEVMCLGFIDGGLNSEDLMVLGGYQLEDYFLEFDLGILMFGFSSSLFKSGSSCTEIKLGLTSLSVI